MCICQYFSEDSERDHIVEFEKIIIDNKSYILRSSFEFKVNKLL